MIIQGDSGTILNLEIIGEGNVPLDLTDCTVIFTIKPPGDKYEKIGKIEDAIKGKTSVILMSEDLKSAGKYEFQATVQFLNGNKFSTKIMNFNVEKKL